MDLLVSKMYALVVMKTGKFLISDDTSGCVGERMEFLCGQGAVKKKTTKSMLEFHLSLLLSKMYSLVVMKTGAFLICDNIYVDVLGE